MSDLINFLILVVFLLIIVSVFSLIRMSGTRRKINDASKEREASAARFRDMFFSALSEVIYANSLERSISSIAEGVMRAYGGATFIFRRDGESAALVGSAAENVEHVADLLRRAGLRLDVDNIPLSEGRTKVFDSNFMELGDPFELIDDLTTYAACKKIQRELHFGIVVTTSAKTESGDYSILILLPAKIRDARRELEQFSLLLKSAVYLANLKGRLVELEARFDERFVQLKNELREKEGAHLFLFNEMPIAAAVLDERGIVIEANEKVAVLFDGGANPVGQPFSTVIGENERQDFIEALLNLAPGGVSELKLSISDRQYKLHIVSRKDESGSKIGSVVYLVDETAGISLQRELERTIDALQSQKEMIEKIIAEERANSEDITRNAVTPTIAVADGRIESVSKSARRVFSIIDGESLEKFAADNEVSPISITETISEVTDSAGRTLRVSQWAKDKYRFYEFNDITELKTAEQELRKFTVESGKLFNSLLPIARVKNDMLVEWNDMFESLFKTFLASEKSFDGFLRYLGESPGVCKSELQSAGIIMRTCRTTDRKSLNMSAAVAEGSILVSIEDLTEQEDVKLQLRNTQNLLSNSLEAFSDEPIFVVDNGIVSALNLTARDKLEIRLDERFDVDAFLTRVGASEKDSIIELNGKFFRIDATSLGNSTVYHFRIISEEIAQRADINRLKRHHDLLRRLALSDRYENVLTNIKDILETDGLMSTKLVCTGTLQSARQVADVYLLTMSSGKIEPSLSLSIVPADISTAEHGGSFSKSELPDSTFSNVVSAGDSMLLIQSASIGEVMGFASLAIQEESLSLPKTEELGKMLKAAATVTIGIHTRMSAERKFEESGRLTRALVGLTGIGPGGFTDIARKTIDLLRQVLGSDAVGVYSVEGATMTSLATNGNLPAIASIPSLKFGVLVPASQLEVSEMKNAEGSYFAVKSRSQKLALIFRFAGTPPAPSELNAISSTALDTLESKKLAESQSVVAAQFSDESKLVNEFMTGLAKSTTSQDVIRILGDSLLKKNKNAAVTVREDVNAVSLAKPMEIVQKEDDGLTVYEVNLLSFGIGVVTVKCSPDLTSRTMVELAVDKMRSILALKLPAVQNEVVDLHAKLDRAKDNYSALRESVEKVPVSLRNARIEIDGVLSRLSFVQGEDRIIQEIKMRLASAAKELSVDLEGSSKNQDDIFETVRVAVMQPGESRSEQDSQPPSRIFDVSTLTEFRVDQTTADLIKDLFVNFVNSSGVADCEVVMMTAQPSPSEEANGRGKHISLRISANEGEMLHDDDIRESGSIQTLAGKLRKMGYDVDTRALGNELTMDICEIKSVEVQGGEATSVILIEDDKSLVEEESQNLLEIFSRLKVAGDAVEAARILESEKFSAAFVDLSLPSINGRELCQQIKRAQPDCVTVLLTNREGEEKSDGVDHIMMRPLDESVIRGFVQK